MIFQVAFRRWDGDSHLQLLDGVSAPTQISAGFTASVAAGKRRSLASLSFIFLKEEAAARAGAVRFCVRTTSQTCTFQVLRAPAAQSGLGGARILVCGASNRRYAISATSPNSIVIGLFNRLAAKEKGPMSMTPGLVAHQRVGPSVINAYFRRRARNWAVHSPVGQMLYIPERALSAVSL